MTEQKGRGTKELEQLKHLSNYEKLKNEKLCRITGIPGSPKGDNYPNSYP